MSAQGSAKLDQNLEQHDPLCCRRVRPVDGWVMVPCCCDVITQARTDERERIVTGIRALMDHDPSLIGRLITPTINYVLGLAVTVAQGDAWRFPEETP